MNSIAQTPSLLEWFHPDGNPRASLVIGSNCPAALLPERQVGPGEDAALIILAPSVEESRTAGWLEGAARALTYRLEADGLGVVLAPPRWRSVIAWHIARHGLKVEIPIGHVPDWSSNHYLVPFTRNLARYAFSELLPLPPWKRILARVVFRIPGAGRLLGYVWPSAGLIVRRPGSRPLFEWLWELEDDKRCIGSALIRRSWRETGGATLFYRFSKCSKRSDTQLPSIAKVTLERSSSRMQPLSAATEAVALNRLSSDAQRAGARVPQILRFDQDGERTLLIQTALDGRQAAELLRSQPDQLWPVVSKVVDWLACWQSLTRRSRPLHDELLDRAILSRLPHLTPLIERGDEYRSWLESCCRSVSGAALPLVAAHNDLTMVNILINRRGRLGIIDWETGQAETWPLGDFFYALTDAVMIASGWPDQLEAFQACFTPGGAYHSIVTDLQARLVTGLNLSAGLVTLCFHACWLHHARNEQLADPPAPSRLSPKPYLSIVQWLALHCNENECD